MEPCTQESTCATQTRLLCFPVVALFTPPGQAGVGGRLGVEAAVPHSARSLMGPSVFVYPG